MSDIYVKVLNMSMTASFVALAVILIRQFLKKVPKVYSYVLWIVVLFRLVCPFTIESALSLIPKSKELPVVFSQYPAVNMDIGFLDLTMNETITANGIMANNSGRVNAGGVVNFMNLGLNVLTHLWIAGVLVIIFYAIVSYMRLRKTVSTATLVEKNIYETDRIKAPFLLGFFRPRIFLPVGLSENEKSYIISHEENHIRRGDNLVKPIAFLALALHWFNPIIWLSYSLMVKDMEMSCDEAVMKKSNEDVRKSYSASLLSMASKQSGFLTPLAFGEDNVKSRIKNIINYKKPALWILAICAAAVILVVAGLAINPLNTGGIGNGSNDGNIGGTNSPVSTDSPVSTNSVGRAEDLKLPYVISKNEVTLADGSKVFVNIELIDGRYFSDNSAGNTYGDNWEGKYLARVYKDEASYENPMFIEGIKVDNQTKLNFGKSFPLVFDDYNYDGNPDFTLGQWGSNNGNVYDIFTVYQDGRVSKLNCDGEIYISGHEFSTALKRLSPTSFSFLFYDNSRGVEMQKTFEWKADKFALTGYTQNEPHRAIEERLRALPKDYKMEAAIADGCFVIVHGSLKSDIGILSGFINDVNAQKASTLTIFQYTVEGDPIMTGIIFDGQKFYAVQDNTRDKFGGSLEKYMKFEFDFLKTVEHEGMLYAFLVNDPSITLEKLQSDSSAENYLIFAMNSSQTNSLPDTGKAIGSSLGKFYSALENSSIQVQQSDQYIEITPKEVFLEANVRLFKEIGGSTGETYVLYNDKAYHIGYGFGGYGVTSVVPFDVNSDGVTDLVYAYSWGSGMHRSLISWFDMKELAEHNGENPQNFRTYDLILRIENEKIAVYGIKGFSGEYAVGKSLFAYPTENDITSFALEKDGVLEYENGKLVLKK